MGESFLESICERHAPGEACYSDSWGVLYSRVRPPEAAWKRGAEKGKETQRVRSFYGALQ